MAPLAMMMARGEWRKDEGGGGMERGFRVSGRGGLPGKSGFRVLMGAVLPDGGQEHGQEGEGDDGQVVQLAHSGNEIGNQVNGGKGVGRRQQEEHQLTFGEKPRFSLPAAEIVDGPDQQLLVGGVGRSRKIVFHVIA